VRDNLDASHLRVLGVVVTLVDHTNVARDIVAALQEQFGDLLFETTIPRNVVIEEAHSRQKSVIDYAPESKGAEAYLALVDEVMKRG